MACAGRAKRRLAKGSSGRVRGPHGRSRNRHERKLTVAPCPIVSPAAAAIGPASTSASLARTPIAFTPRKRRKPSIERRAPSTVAAALAANATGSAWRNAAVATADHIRPDPHGPSDRSLRIRQGAMVAGWQGGKVAGRQDGSSIRNARPRALRCRLVQLASVASVSWTGQEVLRSAPSPMPMRAAKSCRCRGNAVSSEVRSLPASRPRQELGGPLAASVPNRT